MNELCRPGPDGGSSDECWDEQHPIGVDDTHSNG